MPRFKPLDRACNNCGGEFVAVRDWHRFCSDACRREAYASGKEIGEPCVYCGMVADTLDHVPPQTARPILLDMGITRYRFVEVRCCRECNCALGARALWTVATRRKFIKKWLRRHYAKYLRIPEWSGTEIAEMGHSLQRMVIHGIGVRDLVRERIAFKASAVRDDEDAID